jgi:hypothetical protein
MNALARRNQLRWNQLNTLEDLQHSLRSLFGRGAQIALVLAVGVHAWLTINCSDTTLG